MQLQRRKNRFRKVILWLCLGIGLYFGMCYKLADRLIHMPRTKPEKPSEFATWQPVKGVNAWVTPSITEGKRETVFVLCHGLGGDRGYYTNTGLELQKRGYQVVILPMTGQDDNPSETVGFGPAESALIRQTVRALKAEKTILVGCSLGGSAVWLASDEPGVSAVITDSAFARLDDACKSWLKKDLPGGDIVLRPVIWFGTARVGVKPSEVNPVEVARKWSPSRPALVIHGERDRLFTISNADDLSKASGASSWIVPDKGHAQPVDDPAYVDVLVEIALKTKS
jgi:pimeloyl-ACP methyl ester carboxylesterase